MESLEAADRRRVALQPLVPLSGIAIFKLALRNVFRQKARTAVTLAAIAFGVVGLVLSGGFVQDVFIQLSEAVIHSQSGHLQITRAGFLKRGTRVPFQFAIDDVPSVKAAVAALDQVEDVIGRVYFSGLVSTGRSDLPVVGEGVEPEGESRLGTHMVMVAGRPLVSADAHGLMVGEGLARALGLELGDPVTILLNTADGALNTADFTLVGVFQTYSKEFDARAVRIPLRAAQALLGINGVNSLVVSLRRTSDTDMVRSVLSQRLDPKIYELSTWQELNDFYQKTVDLYKRQFGVLQLIVLLMVLLSVANSVNMNVFERAGEFGTMRALGSRTGQIVRLILVESAILGFLGALLGIALGMVLALAISAVGIPMPPPPNANLGYIARIRIVPEEIAMAFAVGFAATVAASLLPAKKVVRMPVVEALRQSV